MDKRFLTVLAVIVLGFIGIFSLGRNKANAPAKSTTSATSNHVTGTGSKGVTLIEYGDYQCPACGAYYPIVKSLVDKYKDQIYFQFRNFPLVQIHPNAFASARAAEAADKQGKFWEMHDLLYEQQTSWSSSSNVKPLLEQYATQLGLDLTKFRNDYGSDDVNSLINNDIKAGQALGANSTPTFVLDGRKIDNNPQSQEAFDKLIETEIASQNK